MIELEKNAVIQLLILRFYKTLIPRILLVVLVDAMCRKPDETNT
jgi:hypothetical protein